MSDIAEQGRRIAEGFKKEYKGELYLVNAFSKVEDTLRHLDLPQEIGKGLEKRVVQLMGMDDLGGGKVKTTDTSYVVGMAAGAGTLYAITRNSVYALKGPEVFPIINEHPFLQALWEELKNCITAKEHEVMLTEK